MSERSSINREQGRRLRQARIEAGYRSAREAALENEWPESTYRAHESGTRTIGQDDAERYARRFAGAGANTSAQMILFGDNEISPQSIRPPEISEAFVPRFSRRRIPILGRGAGGPEGKFIMNGEKAGEVHAPAAVEDVDEAYAVWVHGTSMEPRYYAGEVVIVNPRLPVRQGHYVVVQIRPEIEGDPPEGYIKRFVSHNSRELVLEQHNPSEGQDRIIRISATNVLSVHRIVSSSEV